MSTLGLWSLILSLPLGALGWLATNFIARPVLRVFELREKVWEEVLDSANASMLDGAKYDESSRALRRLAAQAAAIDVAWPQGLRWLLGIVRLDLRAASAGLLGLSNTLGGSPEAWRYRLETSRALQLPTDFAANRGASLGSGTRHGETAA